MRHQNIRVERGSRGFGLSLIYKGLDQYPEEDTGTFVAKVVPGGNSQRAGLRENDKILKINNKVPRDVNDAVNFIKKAGRNMILTIERDDMSESPRSEQAGGLSRSGSVRSFNTQYGASRPQSPNSSSDEEDEGIRRQQEALAAQQSELAAQAAAMAEEAKRQEEVRLRIEKQKEEMVRQQVEYERQKQQQLYMQQQQAEYERQMKFQADHERQLQAEHERQMEIQAETERQRKLQADLDLAQTNAGRSRRDRTYTESSDDENWPPTRSKSLDARKSMRSKSPGSYSTRSGISFTDLTDENKLTRNEEKVEMQSNNNRLAGYIDKVRQLQTENSRMTKQIEVIEVSQIKEISDIRVLYDREVHDLKSAVEELSKKYKDLQNNSEGILTDNRDLKAMQERKNQEIKERSRAVPKLQEEIQKLKTKISIISSGNDKAKQDLKDVLPEFGRLKERLYELNRQLEQVRQEKTKLEALCKDLSYELKNKVDLMETQLHAVKSRKQTELSEISGKLEKEYEDRVQKMLAELRNVYENQMKQNRDDFTKKYESKISVIQTMLSKERAKNNSNNGELEESQRRISALISKVKKLEGDNFELNKNIEILANNMDEQVINHRNQISEKDAKIRQTLEEIQKQMEAYQNLMQTKTALDMEIAVYKKLLECEEDRLGIVTGHDDSFDLSSDEPSSPDVRYRFTTNKETTVVQRRNLSQTQL
eukprot:GFUD01014013.1.p1 GENE.GFUD01014013.1~~GFUD01014013.1.p1  ORF type:complete len:709 (+),score=215.46 GFUD01014013.1:147-2273(+)